MPVSIPQNPSIGDRIQIGSRQLEWNGSRWIQPPSTPSVVAEQVVEQTTAAATAKADEAEADAIAAAAVDAQTKADAAQAAAVEAAAVEAQVKADAAQAAAVEAAAVEAQAKADAAQAAAIAQAAVESQAKADAAQAAAIEQAAVESQAKADAAQAAAIAQAAVESQAKADEAAAQAVANITGGASEAFDTLKEISDAMATDQDVAAAISQISPQQLVLDGNDLSISDGNTIDLSGLSGGATGPAGPAGADGATGPAGPEGPAGAEGPQGIQGIQGAAGLGITFLGEIATESALPPSGNTQGDAYLIQADDSLHVWDSAAWVSGGSIQGPQGIQGIQGIQGLQGIQGIQGEIGPAGADGATGPAGPAGPQGIQGEIGPQGIQGIQGATGLGITFLGDIATESALPPSGNTQGDAYLVQADDSLHVWDGAAWVNGGSIQGPQGIQGIQGIQGPQGIQGTQGLQGETGPQGLTGLTGPAGADGADGADSTVPGPQGLTGLTGPVGPQGAQGQIGPQGLQGETGPQGLTGLTGPVGPQGAQGQIGPQGLQGETGPQGLTGLTGPAGADGADGADSTVPGPQGLTGLTGPAGADGVDGATGPAGLTGPAGVDGADGATGPAGPQGLQGLKGDTGDTGPAGATTLTGLTDTTLSNLQTYNFLQWNGSAWINDYASIRHLTDVDSAGPLSDDDVMVWNAVESQFEFKKHQTVTSLSINANILKYTDEDGVETNIDLSTYLDDTNLARISGGTLNATTGVATFTRDDASTFTLDLSDLLNITLSDISVGTPATASGNGALSYDNTTGVFTYTPPVIPADMSDLTDTSNLIPTDISDLSDTTSVIPTDFSDLTDTSNILAGTIAASDLDMGGNKVLFANVYNNEVDLPSASTYHGMFAHVHGTGKGYYAHAGSWIPLATESQVANISFSDINSKPTTIAGYGITDAVVDFADLGVTPTTLVGYGITDVVPTELSDLTDVSISTPSDGQIMIWNGSNNRFEVGEIGSAITTFEKGIYEVVTNKSHALDTNVTGDATANSGGTVIFDTSINGNLFHYWNNQMSSSFWTADITNVQTSNYQFTNVTLIIRQQAWGNTSTVGSLPTTYKLDGQTHSIQWADGLAPSATINGVDVIQLTIMPIETSDGTGVPIYNSYSILGTHTSHPHQQ